jgi:CMP-N,N'-diacetyllegionaminic acid synthase
MFNKKKILGILPARAGSKEIKNKNLKIVGGKPLVYWSAKALANSKLVDYKLCTTDSKIIFEICKKIGLEVPWMRPKKLSGDLTDIRDVIIHAVSKVKEKFNILVLVQATSPMVKSKDIDDAIKIFVKNKSNILISATKLDEVSPEIIFLKKNNNIEWLVNNKKNFARRQSFINYFKRVGLIYIINIKKFIKTKSFFSKKTSVYEVPKKKSITIDTYKDLEEARKIFRNL